MKAATAAIDLNTDDLDAILDRVRSLAIIGSTSADDSEHLNNLFMSVLEHAEQAQALVSNLALRAKEGAK